MGGLAAQFFPGLNLLNYRKSQSIFKFCAQNLENAFVMSQCPTLEFGHKYFKLMILLFTTKSVQSPNFMNVVYHRYKLYKVGIGDFQTCKPV